MEYLIYRTGTSTQLCYSTFVDVFSNYVTDVKRHKKPLNFAVRSFSMQKLIKGEFLINKTSQYHGFREYVACFKRSARGSETYANALSRT